MGWVFGISWMLLLLGTPQVVLAITKTLRDHLYTSWNLKTWLLILIFIAMILAAFITFGVAWWTNWKGKISARGWGIAASLVFVLFSIEILFERSVSTWGVSEIELAIGVMGLIAFSRGIEAPSKTDDPKPENKSD
jgi:membrane protein YdbS with pleckstrin-like domain